ncbi:hypothetical protein I120019D2_08830 [Parabacteroides merdae]|jgi:hypothetical protein|uniref:Uncharacterized protein n=1 Tax=Parabacteroides merdae TaxID=46503 RepID=A0AA37K5Y7_9BACT|nr:hypothetical protein CE91St3_17540 [Parabacteroides merdae]
MQQQFVVYDIQCNDGNGVFRTTITGEICYMDILHVVDVTPMGQEMGWCDDDIPDFHIMESIYAYLFSLYLSRLDDDCQILPTNTLFLGGV